jgi:hypothetical protein
VSVGVGGVGQGRVHCLLCPPGYVYHDVTSLNYYRISFY